MLMGMANDQLLLCLIPMNFIHIKRATLMFPYQKGTNSNFFL